VKAGRAIPVLLAVLLLGGACKGRVPASSPGAPGTTSPASSTAFAGKLTAAEIKWGTSPTRNSEVTYQDDVVLIEHGAEAIRSMDPNGLAWTIDANAPHADEIKPDKIMFATGRAVGRVLAVERKGNDLAVTLGPVEITDVIKDCNISSEQPLDLGTMVAYSAPDYPGAVADASQPSESSGARQTGEDAATVAVILPSGEVGPGGSLWDARDSSRFRSMLSSLAGSHSASAAPAGDGAPLNISDFRITPFCCGGLGVKLVHDGSDGKITAYAVLRLKSPSLRFNLVIAHGSVQTAEVELMGAAGLGVHFDAGTAAGVPGNINKTFFVPVDLSLPISGIGAPFAVTLRQTMTLTTFFTVQTATLSADGEYEFQGSISMGLHNGSWGASAPTSLTTKQSLLQSMGGASLGVNGLTFGYGGKVIVGIGAFGFVTGPYMGYNTVIGITKGSDMTMVASIPCRSAILDVSMRFGVGYLIPQPVTSAINFILKRLNLKPISSSGGAEHTEALIHKSDVFPAGCGAKTE
jgi:hypothetical protein